MPLKRQVSTAGSGGSYWIGPRRILNLQPPEFRLFAVDLREEGGRLEIGEVHPLWGGRPSLADWYAPAADGKRILTVMPLEDAGASSLTLVTNWAAELRRR
jgi:hypothetical protein